MVKNENIPNTCPGEWILSQWPFSKCPGPSHSRWSKYITMYTKDESNS